MRNPKEARERQKPPSERSVTANSNEEGQGGEPSPETPQDAVVDALHPDVKPPKRRPPKVDLESDEDEQAAIAKAREQGMHVKPQKVRAQIRAYTQKYPVYVIDQLKAQAKALGTTERHILLLALNESSYFTINDEDMIADLRKKRNKGGDG